MGSLCSIFRQFVVAVQHLVDCFFFARITWIKLSANNLTFNVILRVFYSSMQCSNLLQLWEAFCYRTVFYLILSLRCGPTSVLCVVLRRIRRKELFLVLGRHMGPSNLPICYQVVYFIWQALQLDIGSLSFVFFHLHLQKFSVGFSLNGVVFG